MATDTATSTLPERESKVDQNVTDAAKVGEAVTPDDGVTPKEK